ncbi:hypothetical protein ACI2JA_15730 [Alkalihalobacillus sp. NPDC078783]
MAITYRVTNVNFQYDENGENQKVELNFSTTDPERQIYMNGQVPISTDEYFQAGSLSAMSDIVKEKVLQRLTETDEESLEN